MRVRLVRKLADLLDGVDVSGHSSGDILELSRHDAELLIAERWAEPEATERERRDWRRADATPAPPDPAGRREVEHPRDVNRERTGTDRNDRNR